jgi:hypothetical protein
MNYIDSEYILKQRGNRQTLESNIHRTHLYVNECVYSFISVIVNIKSRVNASSRDIEMHNRNVNMSNINET